MLLILLLQMQIYEKALNSWQMRGELVTAGQKFVCFHLKILAISDLNQSPGQIAGLFVPHFGHGIGILKTVALSSMSGASNFVPQHGQRNQVLPLTIIAEIIIVPLTVPREDVDVAGIFHPVLDEHRTCGSSCRSKQNLGHEFQKFSHSVIQKLSQRCHR